MVGRLPLPPEATIGSLERGDGRTKAFTVQLTKNYAINWIMVFLPSARDGRTIATSLKDVVRVWDAETGELTHTLKRGREEGFGNVGSLALSPDGRILASGHNSLRCGA